MKEFLFRADYDPTVELISLGCLIMGMILGGTSIYVTRTDHERAAVERAHAEMKAWQDEWYGAHPPEQSFPIYADMTVACTDGHTHWLGHLEAGAINCINPSIVTSKPVAKRHAEKHCNTNIDSEFLKWHFCEDGSWKFIGGVSPGAAQPVPIKGHIESRWDGDYSFVLECVPKGAVCKLPNIDTSDQSPITIEVPVSPGAAPAEPRDDVTLSPNTYMEWNPALTQAERDETCKEMGMKCCTGACGKHDEACEKRCRAAGYCPAANPVSQ